MHLVIPRKSLLGILTATKGATDPKSPMPVLANVLLTAARPVMARATLTSSATDLYRAATCSVEADVRTEGTVCLPAKDLAERVAHLPDAPVEIETIDGDTKAVLRGVGSSRRYTLHGIPGGEFPQLPKPEADAAPLHLLASTLAQLLARTIYSVSTDTTRPHLNSALFSWTPDRVRMVSTDGHRLSLADAAASTGSTGEFLAPLGALSELRRILDAADDGAQVTIARTLPWAHVTVGALLFSFKLVDAQFPPYQQVIPSHGKSVRVSREALRDAVRAVSSASPPQHGGVKLTFVPNAIRITAESAESGSGFDEVPASYSDSEVLIGINARYALEALAAFDDDEADLLIGGELDPMVVSPRGSQAFIGVLMPMRV